MLNIVPTSPKQAARFLPVACALTRAHAGIRTGLINTMGTNAADETRHRPGSPASSACGVVRSGAQEGGRSLNTPAAALSPLEPFFPGTPVV